MSKKYSFVKKTLVFGTILLFFGVSIVSAFSNNVMSTDVIRNIENPSPDLETFYPTDDAKISQDDPNKNYDGATEINIRNEFGGGGGSGWCSDGLYRFDISSIPLDASIIRATFYLFYNKWTSTNPIGRMLNVYRITSDWNEDTVTWNTAPTYNPVASAFSPVPATVNVWMEWDVTSDIQEFVSGTTNYGWRLRDDNYWGTVNIPLSQFRTREAGQELSPYLEIEYTKSRSRYTIDGDCDCLDVTNSDRPICDKIQQWINTFNQKIEEIGELIEQYKYNPILGRLYALQALFLMGRVIHFTSYWFLLDCNT